MFYTSQLKKYNILATDGEIGKVKDVYFDDDKWAIRYAIADTRKWLPGRKVPLSPSSFIAFDNTLENLQVDYDKETIRQSPEIPENEDLTRESKQRIDQYYGWAPYWPEIYGGGQMATVDLNIEEPQEYPIIEEQAPIEPAYNLRSEEETINFRVHANDGKLGKIVDFIYDADDWKIKYIVVESSESFLNEKYYLVLPEQLESADWLEGDLYVKEDLQFFLDSRAYRNKHEIDAILDKQHQNDSE